MDASIGGVRRGPWNKGNLVSQKVKVEEIWAIRVRLQIQVRARDLALPAYRTPAQVRSAEHRPHLPCIRCH